MEANPNPAHIRWHGCEVITHIGDHDQESNFLREIFKLIPDFQSKIHSGKEAPLKRKMLLTCRTDYFKTLAEQTSFFQLQNRDHINPQKDYTCGILLPFNEEQIQGIPQAGTARQGYRASISIPSRTFTTWPSSLNGPVLLDFLTEIIDDIEKLIIAERSVTTATIYRRIVNKSFDRDKAKHEIPEEIKITVLEEIAARLWKRSSRRIEFNRLAKFLSQILSDGTPDMKKLYLQKKDETLYKDLRNATPIDPQQRAGFWLFPYLRPGILSWLATFSISWKPAISLPWNWPMSAPRPSTLYWTYSLKWRKMTAAPIRQNFQKAFAGYGPRMPPSAVRTLPQRQHPTAMAGQTPDPLDLHGLHFEKFNLKGTPQQPIDLSGGQSAKQLPDAMQMEACEFEAGRSVQLPDAPRAF